MLNAFLESVRDPRKGTISPKRVGRVLRLPMLDVARLANVHRNTLARTPDSPAVQARLGEVARVVAAATELLGGDVGRAVIWFRHQPLAGFDGKTAAEMLEQGHTAAVLAHLEMLRDGVYA